MLSSAKHAFNSLRWYAKQDAEAWKLVIFLVSVLFVAVGLVSVGT